MSHKRKMKNLSGFFLSLVAGLILATVPPARSAPAHPVDEPPVQITAVASNVFLVDFIEVLP